MNVTEEYLNILRDIASNIMENEPVSYADGLAICEAIGAIECYEHEKEINKALAKMPVNKGTSEFETTMEINGNSYPCTIEYEDHPSDGIIIYSVIVSREVHNVYNPDGEFMEVDYIVVDMTKFMTDADRAGFADEITDWMRKENAA